MAKKSGKSKSWVTRLANLLITVGIGMGAGLIGKKIAIIGAAEQSMGKIFAALGIAGASLIVSAYLVIYKWIMNGRAPYFEVL